MKLLKPAQQMLTELYQHYQETGDLSFGFLYSEDPKEKRREIQTIEQLALAGFIEETAPAFGSTELKLTRSGIEYFEETLQPQPQVINFNVSGNVENSILGNQTNASINMGTDLGQIEALISSISGPDHELLTTLTKELTEIQNTKNLKAGSLSKFGSVLTKYPKLFDSVGALLAKLALGLLQ